MFISKAAINISGGLLLVFCLMYSVAYVRKDFLKNKPYVAILLLPLFIGLFFSFFSYTGPEGVVAFMARYRFFLMVLPFAVFIKKKSELNGLLIALNISGFIGMMYGFINSNLNNLWGHFHGLHIIGRNSDMIFALCLLNVVFLFQFGTWRDTQGKIVKSLLIINSCLLVSGLLFIGQRGPILCFCIGLILFSILFQRRLLILLAAVVIAVPLLFSDSWLMQRIKSIGDLDHNISNIARLHLYKTGLDFVVEDNLFLRGTGAKKADKPFSEYFKQKPSEYQKKYKEAARYPGNFHNSFLQMAIEAGLLFLVLFLGGFIYLLRSMIDKMKLLPYNEKAYVIAAVIVTISFFISQIFHGGLYRYPGIVFYIIFLCGCFVVNEKTMTQIAQDEESFT